MTVGIFNTGDNDNRFAKLLFFSPAPILLSRYRAGVLSPSWANDNALRLTGWTRDEMPQTAHWWAECLHPNDLPAIQEKLPQLECDGQLTLEYRLRDRKGDVIWVRDELRVVEKGDDGGLEVAQFWTDISDLVEARRQTRKADARFHDFAQAAAEWFWESDSDHRFTYFSEGVADALGIETSTYLGKRRDEVTLAVNKPRNWPGHLEDLEKHRPFRDLTYSLRTPEGQLRHIKVNGKPFFDEGGDFRGYRGAGRDITREVEAEREASLAHERLIEVIASLPVAFSQYDKDDRLVFCNQTHKDFYPKIADIVTPGLSYEEHVRAAAKAGYIQEDIDDLEGWIRERINVHRNPGPQIVRKMADGRWILIIEKKTARGDIISIHTDITAQMTAQEESRRREEALRDFTEIATDWFWETDADLRYSAISERYEKYAGIPIGTALGKTRQELMDLYYPDEEKEKTRKWQEHFELQKAHKPYRNIKYQWRRPDGEVRTWISGAKPVFDEAGNFQGYRGTTLDITDSKRVEDALIASEARLAGILNIAPEAIIAVDEDHRIRLFNTGAENIFGHKAEDMIGKPLDLLLPPEYRESHKEHFARFAKAAENSRTMAQRDEIVGFRKDGARFPAAASISKFESDGEKIFTVLLQDITERKKEEQQLLDAKEQAEMANRVKSEFLATMSHELRTPLNAVIGFSDVIMGELLGPLNITEYKDYAEDIYHSGRHLLAIINDILDISRIEAGSMELVGGKIGLPALVQSCRMMVRQRAGENNIQLTTDLDQALPLLWADERKMKQVLVNLMSNAVKFTPPGGKITVKGELLNSGEMAISVTDTGIGMSKDEAVRALEPFTQIGNYLSRQQEGTGLGLAIVNALVKLHDGHIAIESEQGAGTSVTLTFPRERVLA